MREFERLWLNHLKMFNLSGFLGGSVAGADPSRCVVRAGTESRDRKKMKTHSSGAREGGRVWESPALRVFPDLKEVPGRLPKAFAANTGRYGFSAARHSGRTRETLVPKGEGQGLQSGLNCGMKKIRPPGHFPFDLPRAAA